MKHPSLLLAVLLSVMPMAASAQSPACPQFFVSGQPPALLDARLAQWTTELCNDAFGVLASGVTHGALWSAQHPTIASLDAARMLERINRFDPELHIHLQPVSNGDPLHDLPRRQPLASIAQRGQDRLVERSMQERGVGFAPHPRLDRVRHGGRIEQPCCAVQTVQVGAELHQMLLCAYHVTGQVVALA